MPMDLMLTCIAAGRAASANTEEVEAAIVHESRPQPRFAAAMNIGGVVGAIVGALANRLFGVESIRRRGETMLIMRVLRYSLKCQGLKLSQMASWVFFHKIKFHDKPMPACMLYVFTN